MIPALLQKYFQVPFQFGGTGLLIVVGVALDTVQQIESHLITRNYEGFAGPKGPRIRGRVAARTALTRPVRSVRIHLKSKDELRMMREAGLVAAEILERDVRRPRSPASSTWELDRIARARDRRSTRSSARSSATRTRRIPAVLCTSINEVVVHGIPRKTEVLQDGDIIGIDFGIFKHGFCADTARTVHGRQRLAGEAQAGRDRARRARGGDRAVPSGQPARRHRPRGPELCGITTGIRSCASSSATAPAARCTRTRRSRTYGDGQAAENA